MPYVVWVEFEIAENERRRFLGLITANAADSVRVEPGCSRFDVLEAQDGSGAVALYEIYDSEAAFRDHLESAHFKTFNALSEPIVLRKTVRTYTVRQNSKIQEGNAR